MATTARAGQLIGDYMATNNATNNVKPLNVVTVTTDTVAIENYTLYLCTYTAGPMTLTLPTTAKAGSYFILTVMDTDKVITINQNDGQCIYSYPSHVTTVGITGSCTITPNSSTYMNSYRFYCIKENFEWIIDYSTRTDDALEVYRCMTYA
jgi:hypothetical protein